MAWPVGTLCMHTAIYHLGSGSHEQLFSLSWGLSGWHSHQTTHQMSFATFRAFSKSWGEGWRSPLATLSTTPSFFRWKQKDNWKNSPPTNCMQTQQLESLVTTLTHLKESIEVWIIPLFSQSSLISDLVWASHLEISLPQRYYLRELVFCPSPQTSAQPRTFLFHCFIRMVSDQSTVLK